MAVLVAAAAVPAGCRRGAPVVELDHPRLTSQVRVMDTTVHSNALGKDMPLRIVVPADAALASRELPVVYFLHGAGTNLYDWTNHSDIANFAAEGWALVFPDAPGSYYIDDQRSSRNRYERYLTREMVAAVHATVPAVTHDARHTALVGISRGGYGAVVLGLKHPELFSYVGTLSGALDLNLRHFHWSSPIDSGDVQRAFGPLGSATRRANDPYILTRAVPRDAAPFFFVACGTSDSLLPLSQRFAALLSQSHLRAEVHIAPGGHNWAFWGAQLPALEASLRDHVPSPTPAVLTSATRQRLP